MQHWIEVSISGKREEEESYNHSRITLDQHCVGTPKHDTSLDDVETQEVAAKSRMQRQPRELGISRNNQSASIDEFSNTTGKSTQKSLLLFVEEYHMLKEKCIHWTLK